MLFLQKDFGRKKWMPLLAEKVALALGIGMGWVAHQVEQTRMPIMELEAIQARDVISSLMMTS